MSQPPVAVGNYHDSWYASLLSLAEYFRTRKPMRVRECVQCLEAIVQLSLPNRIGARTHLQLGQIYAHYTKNLDLAKMHLERALQSAHSHGGCEDVIGESTCDLANLYCQAGEVTAAKQLLYEALDLVRQQQFWYCRLLFFLSQLHVDDGDFPSAYRILETGVEYTQAAGSMYAHALFLLTKGMLLITEKRAQEANSTLIGANGVIEKLSATVLRKQNLKSFLLVLQVCYCLSSGNVKDAKNYLRDLQAAIQAISRGHDQEQLVRNTLDCFQWMPKEHLCVVVYILTVLHNMQSGQHEKAQMYAEKALIQVQKLKQQLGGSTNPLLHAFEILIIEHDVMSRLNTGNRALAIREIHTATDLARRFPRLFGKHEAQFHTLLGLYGISTNSLPAAENQFNSALRLTRDKDLWIFVNLNLAILYLRMGREQEFAGVWERIVQSQPQSKVLKATSYYVKGLYEFFHGRYEESKKQLRDSLQMANSDDMNRIVCCSLVILGHIFLSHNDIEQGQSLTSTALNVARMTSDVSIQLWSVTLLRDLARAYGDHVKYEEFQQIHSTLAQNWVQDQRASVQKTEHQMLQWLDGPYPAGGSTTTYDQYPVHQPAGGNGDGSYAYSGQMETAINRQ